MHDGSSTVLTINDPDSLNNDAGVTSVAISPDGRWVAAGSLDTVVRIWEVGTGKLVERLRGHRDSVYSVAFTPDGRGLVSGSLDKTLKYWDVSGLSVGGAGAGASGGVKSKKEGAAASSAGSSVGRKDEKASQCTMNFTGHKVCFIFFFPSPFLSKVNLFILFRTTSSLSLSPTTVPGSSRAPKTAACNSGTRIQRLCSACYRGIRIR